MAQLNFALPNRTLLVSNVLHFNLQKTEMPKLRARAASRRQRRLKRRLFTARQSARYERGEVMLRKQKARKAIMRAFDLFAGVPQI